MPKISVYNQEGKVVGDVALSDAIFSVKASPALVHEVSLAQRANARRAIANVKTRGEVRGGGKKPWKQKGTGRARQGSIRAPNWVGGGIVFGPTSERNFSVKVNKKAKRKALFMVLSDKVSSNAILAIDTIDTTTPKTKKLVSVLAKLPLGRSTLVIAPASNPAMFRMIRNVPTLKFVTVHSVNIQDLLTYKSVLFLKDAVPAFEKMYQS